MKTKFVILAIFALAIPAYGQLEQGDIQTVAFSTQDDDQDVDWKAEHEKLELRLRELEDDFVQQRKLFADTNQSVDTGSMAIKSELESLTESVDQIDSVIAGIEKQVPRFTQVGNKTGHKMTIFGRIHLSYFGFSDIDASLAPITGANPQDDFRIRRLRIGVKGDVADNMFYKIQTEFAGANNFQFRDVFLGFKNLPFFNTVTVGNHKRPYNLDQLNSSNDNVFLDRPFVGDAFNDNNRRLGISSSGHSDDLKYNWRTGIYNMQNIQTTGAFTGDNYQLELASRYAATPWYDETSGGRGYLHVAFASASRFPDGLGPNNLSEYSTIPEALLGNVLDTGPIFGAESESLYGLEAVWNVGAFQLTAEYMETFVDRFEPAGPNLNFHGGYVYAAYMLTGEHMPWNRKKGTLGRVVPFENFFAVRDCDGATQRGWGAWQIAARYSYLDLNDEDVVGGQAKSLTLGLNWYWNRNARMQFNFVNGEVSRLPLAEGNYDIFGTQFEIFF